MPNQKHIKILIVSIILLALAVLAGSLYFSKHADSDRIPVATAAVDEVVPKEKLESFYDNKNDYEKAFSDAKIGDKKDITAGIISHHFLAKDLIANFFANIKNDDVRNVVIVGPDHYGKLNQEKYFAATTLLSWDTPYGGISPDSAMIKDLIATSDVAENDPIFKNEHSIYTLVPFIKRTFPNAKIIPLIIKDDYEFSEFEKLGSYARKISLDGTILIVSSDFSHDLSADQSRQADEASISNLTDFNPGNVKNINCDCKACMAFAQGYLGSAHKFYLLENKNSSDFGSQDKTVTSYISAYFLK